MTPATALAWAELVADGAPRPSTRGCAVAAIAYHVERDERRALDAVERVAAGSRAQRRVGAAVLRGVLREALGRGDSDAAEKIIGELERRGAGQRRPWTAARRLRRGRRRKWRGRAAEAGRRRAGRRVRPPERRPAKRGHDGAAGGRSHERGPRSARDGRGRIKQSRSRRYLVLALIYVRWKAGRRGAAGRLVVHGEVAHDAFLDVPRACEAVAAAATARLGDEGAFVANNPDVALRQAAVDCVVAIAAAAPRARRRPTPLCMH